MTTISKMTSAKSVKIAFNIDFQPPLSRSGCGPGLILIRPSTYLECQQYNTSLDPEPLQKWAEESFAVAQITLDAQSIQANASVRESIQRAKDGLTAMPEAEDSGQFAVIGWRKLCLCYNWQPSSQST